MTFKKGDLVHYIRCWNETGDFCVTALQVYSCGKKQMVLVDRNGVKFKGAHFRPQVEQWGQFSFVVPNLTDDEAVALAATYCPQYQASEIQRKKDCAARVAAGQYASEGYARAMARDIAAIEANVEPKVHLID